MKKVKFSLYMAFFLIRVTRSRHDVARPGEGGSSAVKYFLQEIAEATEVLGFLFLRFLCLLASFRSFPLLHVPPFHYSTTPFSTFSSASSAKSAVKNSLEVVLHRTGF